MRYKSSVIPASSSAQQGSNAAGAAVAANGVAVATADEAQAVSHDWSWETAPAPIADSDIVETVEHEYVVVGAGLAGLSTTCSLAENGADVICIEKTEAYGYRGDHYGAINNKYWLEQGVEIDPAEVARDWVAQCNSRCNERLVWKFLNNCGEAINWLGAKVEERGFTPRCVEATFKGATYREYYGTMVFSAPRRAPSPTLQRSPSRWSTAPTPRRSWDLRARSSACARTQ